MIDWLTGTSRAAEADWPLPPATDWAWPKTIPFEAAADDDDPAAALAAVGPAAGIAPLAAAWPPVAGAATAAGLDAALLELLELLPVHAVRVAEAMTRPVTAEKR